MDATAEQIQGLVALAFDPVTMFVSAGIYVLIRFFARIPWLAERALYRRCLPLLPEILGAGVAVAGGLPVVEDRHVAVQIAAGLWCGYLAQKFHKILGQTILGDDRLSLPRVVRDNPPREEEGDQ